MSLYQHWSKISTNPINPIVMEHVKKRLKMIHSGSHPGATKFYDSYVDGKSVLDIGVVEHDLSLLNRPGWKHNQLRSRASKIVGVDIVEDAVEHLNRKGYDVRLCDATSDADLGERFDTVYIGDVIEHVNNPVRLLAFAARHLKDGGQMVVTTPCPFWWRNILLMFKDGTYIGNVDHIAWVTPVNALELCARANLTLDHYYTMETHGSSLAKRLLKTIIEKFWGRSELFTWAYAYVITKNSKFANPKGEASGLVV